MAALMIPFSILDLSPIPQGFAAADALRNSLDLAQHAERFCDQMDDALNHPRRSVSAANQIQKGVRVGIEVFVIESAAAPTPGICDISLS